MKLSGIIAATALFVTNIAAQNDSFNLTALNGTWHSGGLTKYFYRDLQLITRLLNLTISCPQIYITGNSSDTVYVQPSMQVGWWNTSSRSTQKFNVSMSGLLKLQSSESDSANFTGQFSHLNSSTSTTASNRSSSITMLEAALTGLNVKNPLPQGAAVEANVKIQLGPSTNGTNMLLFSASNFTFPSLATSGSNNNSSGNSSGSSNGTTSGGSNNGTTSGSSDDTDDDEFILQILLLQNTTRTQRNASTIPDGPAKDLAEDITLFNNTCFGVNFTSDSSQQQQQQQ